MEEIIQRLYSEKKQKLFYKKLLDADLKRVKIYEYRNFVDYDLIPIIRAEVEEALQIDRKNLKKK